MKNTLLFEDAYISKDYGALYFFSYDINGIFRINMNEGKTEFLQSVKEYPKNSKRLYGTVVYVGGKLVFAPLAADDILIYDIEMNQYALIPIKKRNDYIGENAKFYAMVARKNIVYIFPAHYPAIIQLDMSDFSVIYHINWLDEINGYGVNGKDYFRQSVIMKENMILAPFCFMDKVLIFDTQSKITRILTIETNRDAQEGFAAICDDGEYYWLLSLFGDEIYKWTFDSGVANRYSLENRNNCIYSFTGALCAHNMVLVIPAGANDIYIIDTVQGSIEKYESYEFGVFADDKTDTPLAFFCIKEIQNGEFLICTRNRDIFKVMFDVKARKVECVEIDSVEAINDWMAIKGEVDKSIINENSFFKVDSYLKCLTDSSTF